MKFITEEQGKESSYFRIGVEIVPTGIRYIFWELDRDEGNYQTVINIIEIKSISQCNSIVSSAKKSNTFNFPYLLPELNYGKKTTLAAKIIHMGIAAMEEKLFAEKGI